jgi:hypothetical protein
LPSGEGFVRMVDWKTLRTAGAVSSVGRAADF